MKNNIDGGTPTRKTFRTTLLFEAVDQKLIILTFVNDQLIIVKQQYNRMCIVMGMSYEFARSAAVAQRNFQQALTPKNGNRLN